MFKRLGELFIDKYYEDAYRIIKTTYNGKLCNIRIISGNGRNLIVYNNYFYDEVPKDTDKDIYFDIEVLEDLLADTDGVESMKEMFDYFLNDDNIDCCIIKCKNYESKINISKTNEDELIDNIHKALIDNCVVCRHNDKSLAQAIMISILNGAQVDIKDLSFSRQKIKRGDFHC